MGKRKPPPKSRVTLVHPRRVDAEIKDLQDLILTILGKKLGNSSLFRVEKGELIQHIHLVGIPYLSKHTLQTYNADLKQVYACMQEGMHLKFNRQIELDDFKKFRDGEQNCPVITRLLTYFPAGTPCKTCSHDKYLELWQNFGHLHFQYADLHSLQDLSVPDRPQPPRPVGLQDLVALDCEMVDTFNHQKVLARISLVDADGSTLLDSFVQPDVEIVDYLTQFSGVTPELLKDVTFKQKDAVAFLQDLIRQNPFLVLVGHSIENDLVAMGIFYDRVMDLTLMYPQRAKMPSAKLKREGSLLESFQREDMGPPTFQRNGLVFLINHVLKEKLDRSTGHDSLKDAQFTMKLALKKLEKGPQFFAKSDIFADASAARTLPEMLVTPYINIDDKYQWEADWNPELKFQASNSAKLTLHFLRHMQEMAHSDKFASDKRRIFQEIDREFGIIKKACAPGDLLIVYNAVGDYGRYANLRHKLPPPKLTDAAIENTSEPPENPPPNLAKDLPETLIPEPQNQPSEAPLIDSPETEGDTGFKLDRELQRAKGDLCAVLGFVCLIEEDDEDFF